MIWPGCGAANAAGAANSHHERMDAGCEVHTGPPCRVLNDVLDSASEVVAKGRLGPGQMVVADLDSGSFLRNEGVCEAAATDAAYDEWLQVLPLLLLPQSKVPWQHQILGA